VHGAFQHTFTDLDLFVTFDVYQQSQNPITRSPSKPRSLIATIRLEVDHEASSKRNLQRLKKISSELIHNHDPSLPTSTSKLKLDTLAIQVGRAFTFGSNRFVFTSYSPSKVDRLDTCDSHVAFYMSSRPDKRSGANQLHLHT
jgi:hypothetical protein